MTINTSTRNNNITNNDAAAGPLDRYFVTILEDSIAPLLDSTNSSNASPGSSASIANLVDPSSNCCAGEWKPYVIFRNHHHQGDNKEDSKTTATICEFQRLSIPSASNTTTKQQAVSNAEYSAFLVAGHVVGSKDDNAMYTLNQVDPLFWVLQKAATQKSSTTRKQQQGEEEESAPWQPLDQIIDGYFSTAGSSSGCTSDNCLRDSVDRKQLMHVFERIEICDEEYCYRFSMKKALRWLQRKQESVQAVLVEQERQAAVRMVEAQQLLLQQGRSSGDGESSSNNNGAFSSCFELSSTESKAEENQCPASNNTACSNSRSKDKNDEKEAIIQVNETRAKEESVQIVCSYLNDDWTERFLHHMDMSKDILLTSAELQAKKKKEQQGDNKRKIDDVNETQQLPAISQDWNEALQQPMMSSDNSNNKSSNINNVSNNSKKLKPNPNKMSVAAKRLAKTNKKGMKTLGNFFTAKKKKT